MSNHDNKLMSSEFSTEKKEIGFLDAFNPARTGKTGPNIDIDSQAYFSAGLR